MEKEEKYNDGEIFLKAFVVAEDFTKKRPAILVFPTWHGRNAFAIDKARELASLGYVGIALDMYGDAKVGENDEENAKLMAPFIEDREKLKKRVLVGFLFATTLGYVKKEKIGGIGFCFGGMCALDLARAGADVKAIVSFHGLLDPPKKSTREKITSQVLVLAGFDDPWVRPDVVLEFEKEMSAQGVDWQVSSFGKVRHGFMNPACQGPAGPNLYNETVCKRSWKMMQNFFEEILL
jgi:dienelactone hydrolase